MHFRHAAQTRIDARGLYMPTVHRLPVLHWFGQKIPIMRAYGLGHASLKVLAPDQSPSASSATA